MVSKNAVLFTLVIIPSCTHTDINHRRCRCPKWIQGTLSGGRFVRISAKTRRWDKAEIKARAMEDVADPHKPGVTERVAIDGHSGAFATTRTRGI